MPKWDFFAHSAVCSFTELFAELKRVPFCGPSLSIKVFHTKPSTDRQVEISNGDTEVISIVHSDKYPPAQTNCRKQLTWVRIMPIQGADQGQSEIVCGFSTPSVVAAGWSGGAVAAAGCDLLVFRVWSGSIVPPRRGCTREEAKRSTFSDTVRG